MRHILLLILLFQAAFACAQAPKISYSSPQVYLSGTAISPLAPVNTGGAVPNTTPVTIASGIAGISGIAVDGAGNVYVAHESNTIMKIPAAGGSPTTIGSGFGLATGVAVDTAGNVYVADYNHNSVAKIPAGGGPVVTIASGLNGPYMMAADAAGNAYVASLGDNTVKKIPAGTNTAINIGSGFRSIGSVAVDASDNVYATEMGYNTVKEVLASDGSTILLASANNGASGIAVDAAGNLYVSGTSSVLEIAAGQSNAVEISSGYGRAIDVAVDKIGFMYVSDARNKILQKVGLGKGYTISPALPTGLNFDTATGIISGMTFATSPATNYTITAYNLYGSNSAIVSIKVQAKSINANLSRLQLSRGTLSPVFAPFTTSYTATVDRSVTSITVTPITAAATATVKVNGTSVTSGTPSTAIPLAIGLNTITTIVTAQNGTTTKTYTVTVNRPGSTNANLSALHLSAGGLSPSFSTATTSYTAKVENTTATITITPTTSDTGATVKVNGASVASGSASAPVALNTGPNTIAVTVTAQDGVTQKTYTITETRALSSNANLATLGQSLNGLTPSFTTSNTSYTLSASNATTSMTLKPVSSDAHATIKVDGTTVTSGTKTAPIALAIGPNTITTVVKAQNGATTKTYTLTVTRATSGADSYFPGISVAKPIETLALADDGIKVHQGISPNGDGVNDFLQIDNISQYPDNKLSIMNRDGQLIYEAKGYDNSSKGFDGHSNKNGQMQVPGTYFYQLDYAVKGILKHKTGFIVLKY